MYRIFRNRSLLALVMKAFWCFPWSLSVTLPIFGVNSFYCHTIHSTRHESNIAMDIDLTIGRSSLLSNRLSNFQKDLCSCWFSHCDSTTFTGSMALGFHRVCHHDLFGSFVSCISLSKSSFRFYFRRGRQWHSKIVEAIHSLRFS